MQPVPATLSEDSAWLVELFSSIQGEGVFIGRRQIFIRFPGCNLTCSYCDTNHAQSDRCCVETTPGKRNFIEMSNPVALNAILSHLTLWKEQFPGLHHSVSITGGEPLLHKDTLAKLLSRIRSIFPVMLETNGVLCDELLEIIDHIDHISMDIKLPSTSGHENLWDVHAQFLLIAQRKNCFIKTIVAPESTVGEINRVSELIAEVNRNIPLILQPVTNRLGDPVTGTHLLQLQEAASAMLGDVRVIPQIHTFLNIL